MESAVVMMRMCGTVREKRDRHVCVDLRDPSRLKAAGVSMDGGWGRRRRRQWLEEVTWLAWDGMSGRGEFRDLHGSTAGLQKQAISGQDLYVWLLPQILGEPKLKAMVIAWGSMIVFNLPFFYLFIFKLKYYQYINLCSNFHTHVYFIYTYAALWNVHNQRGLWSFLFFFLK